MTNHTRPTEEDHITRGAILVLNRDLFFGVRLGNTARQLGYTVEFARETAVFAERLSANPTSYVLGIIDLAAGVAWDQIRALTADPAVLTPLLVFGPHKDVDGLRAAKAAGVRRVVSNGDFHRDMAGLIQRYARPAPMPTDGAVETTDPSSGRRLPRPV